MLKGSNKLKKVILAILSIVAILGIATTASKIANNQKAKIMPASTHVTGQYDLVQPGDENLPETPNVQFDAYFLNDSVKTRGALLGPINGPDLTSVPTKELYMEIKVLSEGYLKNGRIEFTTTNSKFVANLVPDNIINGQYIGNVNLIELKKIDNGTIRVVRGEVHPNVEDKDYLYRTDNKVKLSGIYVDNQGRETPISKTVNYEIETTYGKITSKYTKRSLERENTSSRNNYYNPSKNPTIEFTIGFDAYLYDRETSNIYLQGKLNKTFKSNVFKINNVPKFNGYQAERIEISPRSSKATTNFDKENNTFTIDSNDPWFINDNMVTIKIIYPKESGASNATETLGITGTFQETWYSGSSGETKSNLLTYNNYRTLIPRIFDERSHSYIRIGPEVNGDNVIARYEGANGLPRYGEYSVGWYPYEKDSQSKNIELTEDSSKEGDWLGPQFSSERREPLNIGNYVENTGISFNYNVDNLKEDSIIEIYDQDTGELIHSFNRNEIIEHYAGKKYEYNKAIKHIKAVIKNISIDEPNNIQIINYKRIDEEKLAKDTETNKIPNNTYIFSTVQQKTEMKTYPAYTSNGLYIRRSDPFIKFDIYEHSKSLEQAEYYGEDTSIYVNDFDYTMEISFLRGIKGIRIQDKLGFLMEDSNSINKDKIGLDFIKYKSIYFYQSNPYLGIPDDTYVKVYNAETGELIKSFNKEEILKYNSSRTAYIYNEKIKGIIIDVNHDIKICNIVNIDQKELVRHFNQNDYLNNKKFLINNPKYSSILQEGLEYKNFKQATSIGIMYNPTIGVGTYLRNPINTYNYQNSINQFINLKTARNNLAWKRGTILIEYPKAIQDVQVQSITSDSDMKVVGYNTFKKDGKVYLKIYTNSNKITYGGGINIQSDIIADPFTTETNVSAKVYYYNNLHFEYENSTSDIEDINQNGDTSEKIGITEMPIKIIGPDTLIVRQQLTDFNTRGDLVNSPLVGTIESNGTGKARVNVILANRWAPSVSNIKVFGRIPYKGNKTPVTNQDLNSTFTAGLTGPIILPDEFKNKARVYYSEEDKESTIDINDTSYNWKEYTEGNPNNINWNNVKHFYIDLVDIKFEAKETKVIKYDVNIPINSPVNVKSYATVAATFNLNTLNDGDIVSKSEADKVGVQLVKKYNLNINSLIKGNKNPIAGTIYKVENKKSGDSKFSKTIQTSNDGIGTINYLIVNEEYRLTEESINSDYTTEKTAVDFKVTNQSDGTLALEIQKSGNIVDTKIIQPTETSAGNAVINMEYLQKYSLTLNKLDKETNEPIKDVKYILKETNKANAREIEGRTNEQGEVVFTNLNPGVNYTLKEETPFKYYSTPDITYEVRESNGDYTIEKTSGTVEAKSLTKKNQGQNDARITLVGEKIKTYSIKINKYKKGEEQKLSKAQFSLRGDGFQYSKLIETNNEGVATLDGLYQYIEGKEYSSEYTIKELSPPEGYKKSEGTLKFKVKRNDLGQLELIVLEDTLTRKKTTATEQSNGISIENNIVNIDIENEILSKVEKKALFKLVKKDGKTNENLPNTKFVIYKVNEDGSDTIALDKSGNKIGELERHQNIPNGEGYVVKTNEQGEILLELPKGKYKFIEIEAPDYKYDLPSSEAERTHYFTVKGNKKTYKLVENENLSRVLNEESGTKEFDSIYLNGKTVNYKLALIEGKYHLLIYNKDFYVEKDIELKTSETNLSIYTISNDGTIYGMTKNIPPKMIKFDENGNYIDSYEIKNDNNPHIGRYDGIDKYSSGIRTKGTLFGYRMIGNDKSISKLFDHSAFYNINNGEAIKVLQNGGGKWRVENVLVKPSYKGGAIQLNYIDHENGVYKSLIKIYDDNLNLVKEFHTPLAKYEEHMMPGPRNQYLSHQEIHEDKNGNIYVNNEEEDKINVYDRDGNLLREINKLDPLFTVLPDGKIYFYNSNNRRAIGDHTQLENPEIRITLADNEGNKLLEKTLSNIANRGAYLKFNADGSIEYSDNKEGLVTHKLDLIEEASTEEQQSELVVTNNWKKYKITTSSGEHGTISGAGETPYEEVEIYSNATKEITITPEEGYRIKKVTINGATVPITLNSDNKTMTITKFENMTENKDIKAEFSNQGVTIRTNHYIKDTTTPVSQSEVQTVDMGENYTTAPKTLAKYELEKNERGEYVIQNNASGTVPVVTNPADKRDIEVTYYYIKKKAKVITKYLLDKGDGNTEEIKTPNEQTLEIDTQYTTSSDVGNPKYELIRVDGNSTGTIENTDDITVTYIYRVKRAKVIVKYLDVTESETGTPLPSNDGATVEDVEINGQVDDTYRTTEANNVQANYSLVETPRNATGTMTIAPTTVVYKYRKVAPTINNINVTKVGPNKIASKTQLNTYNITFNVNLSNYIGSGSVKLTDKLPYGIHHEASDELASGLALDGGIYNDATKEIVWNIPISDISSYKQSVERNENNTTITQDGTSVNVTINKTISIRYKDLPNYNQGEEPKIENSIFGKIILDRNNEREVNSKSNSPANYNTAITVKKKWNDNSNSAEKRPTSITFALYKTINGQETKVKDYTLTGSTTTDDGWETKIEQLPLYDGRAQNRDTGITNAGELGNIITYRIEETSSNKFYQRATTKPIENEYILTNTFTVPNDKIEVQVNKVWDDNSNANAKRPTSIKYVLSGNTLTKEQTVTGNTTSNEDWSYKFTDLPKYNAQGNEIVYTVAEQEATTDGLKFYSNEISGEYKTGITIKNKFTVPENKIEVPVTKTWLDDNNSRSKRPTSIKYVLKGGATETEQVVTGNSTTDENWNYTFTNLPKYNAQGNVINYSIEEQEVTTNDLKFYTKTVNGFNVTNTFKVPEDKVTPRVTVTWEDSSNVNGKRPNNVKLVVKDKEGKIVKEATITGNSTDEEWNKVFENVPKYDKNGDPIPYTVEEQPNTPDGLKFYKVKVSGDIDQGFKVINKFEVPDEKIELTVNKTWADDNNANAKRPASIKYVLSGNGLTKEQVVIGNTTTNEDWSYKFTDLPKYNAQGNEIVYTVDEQEVNAGDFKFYTKQVVGLNVTNTFTVPNDKIEVQVNKVWDDNSNANAKRPTSIKYVLSGNTLTKEQTVTGNTTSNEDWSYKFTDLPKYNAQGNEIVYTVAEQEATADGLKFYSNEITGEYKAGITITNTFTIPENKVNVTATKTWVDSSNAKGKRPSSIKYILKGGATPIEKVVSGNNTTDENWSYTFENLAKYDSNGQEYQYSVEEEITENAHLYTKVITGNKESGFNVINTFKVPEDKLTIAVTKEWKDNSNVASKRPTSIKYVLKGGATPIEEVVSGNNTTDADWNHTFTNVAKYNDSGDEITYTLEEQEVSANDFKFYKKAISGDYKAGFKVVNTFEVPDEKVEVQVNKVWEDENNANTKRPTSIKYVLKGGATPVEHVVTGNTNSNADWSYKFTNLPKYSATGDEIQYTVEEQEVNTDELKFYEKEITGSMNSGFNIKNKFKVPDEKVEVQITKTWEDNSNVNGKRPTSIKYVLSGNGSSKEQIVTGNTTTNDNWSYTFANLPKYNSQGNEITYTVEEQEVNPGDLKFYEKQVNGDYQSGFNVTNTFRIPDDKVKVEITKKWEDSSNVSNKRPASVKVELSDGANVVRTQELTGTGNEWKYTFTDLPKYNSQGNTITYTLDEKEVNPGDLQFYTKSIVGNTITNTFTQSTDKINVNVSKTWNDSNNANRKRPVSIKYVLKNKETVASEKVVAGNETTDADWNYTFTGLAKYDEHNDEIKYTLEEQEANEGELKFYTKQVNGDYKAGFNVVNTFKVPEERISVNVSKTWNDDSNSRSKRPTSIKYIITDGQNTVEQIVTGESNTDTNWSYEFSNLVKYEANTGNEISYTVREEEVNPGDLKFYEPTISGDYKAGINVTNKFVVPNDKVTPRVTITWEDNNNNGNKRPSNVKIIVKDKEGKVVKEGNVTGNPTDEEWNKVFENVPKYDKNGDPIPYTVEEKPNSPDDFKFYKITVTGDIDKGYKVTNKFEVPDEKVTVKVKKVWEDSNNAASKRPTAIKVQLKNNAAIVREERVTGSGNEWTYTFENVSKYNGYGDVINYTVEEIEEQTEDLKFYEKKITGDKDSEYVITNKFKVPDEKIEINVNKTWEDNNNAANKRPQSIKYILKGGATDVEQVVSGNRTTDANWNYKFTNLAKYNAQGNEITYTVEEQEVNANDLKFYTKKVSGEQTNGFAVVNKFTVPTEKVTVKVSKTWDDEGNRASKRPASIKYEVLNSNNQIVASKVQSGNKNTADGWSHNFELDKYDALGNEEVYNVQEVEVNQNDFKFYRATVSGNYKSGFTVTNKFEVPNEEVTPKISVEWKDNSNQNNKRPTSVKIQVKDEEGRIVKESPVTGLITEESWKKIFENVPKYNKNGDPINYTITEEPNNPNDLEFYTTTTSGNITEGFKVVNTYAVPGTTISLKANKKWVDGNNAKNKRPESIKIEVRNNNEVVADKEVKGNRTTDANWEVEFKNLPKYNPTTGAENVYTVTETEVHQGELRYYTSVVNGNTITNTIKPITEGKIEDSKVEKESTLAKITKADEIVPYTITYKGKIKEYMGDAVVKIVDELPFKLDLSKSNIMDGSYDDESKTITWTENLNNIDTHSNGDKEVEIKKEIKLVYKDLKISEDNLKVTNKVRAEINLKETNKKITENNTKEIPAEIGSKVTVKYVLKSNRSMKLKEDKVITGHVGDAYQTTIPNDIDQDAYEFVEVEGNENGKISQEEKVVTYLYKKKFGKVVVSYVEKSTGMKLQNDEVIKGNINEPYNAEGKEIEYYNLVSTEKSENAKPVITEDEQKITHYYAKKVFNIEIDKELKEATIDGEKRTFRNGKFTKLDIPVKKILNSEVKVRYSINVRNTGEIKGSTVVQENIPKYFTMNPSENPDWRIENGKIVSKEIELNPGESKELSITLKWTNSKDNFGTLVNKAGIEKTKNNAGFEETDTEEEKKGKKQQATLVLVPKTGLDINKLLQMTGVGITLTALVAAMGYTISRKVRE